MIFRVTVELQFNYLARFINSLLSPGSTAHTHSEIRYDWKCVCANSSVI